MPKYWGKQIFAHGSFPEVGQKQKTEKKKERSKVGNNNGLGQLHIAMSPWVAHASRLGQLFVVGDPFPNTMLSCSSVKE